MKIVDAGAFRTHILLPHDVVGSFTPDAPPNHWLTVTETRAAQDKPPFTWTYSRNDVPVLRVTHRENKWLVTALVALWLQEPCITTKVAGQGAWYVRRQDGKWEGPHTLKNINDPYKNTVHPSRIHSSPRCAQWVEYREGGQALQFMSDGGFQKILNNQKPNVKGLENDSIGCAINWSLPNMTRGVYVPKWTRIRFWELSGGARLPKGYPPGTTQFHMSGWGGGPGAVVNDKGLTPPPGTEHASQKGYNLVWNPAAWRFLRPGQSIQQTLTLVTVRRK